MFDTIILDWSGTLVDDLDAVLEGTNEAFRQCEVPEMSRDQFRREFDLPVQSFYDRWTPHIPFERIDRHFHTGFHRAYDRIQPLAPSEAFLEHARDCGVRLMVLTTLSVEHARRQLDLFAWERFFEEIHAGVHDKIPHLRALVETHGFDRDRTVYVGDLPHDIEAGKAAGIRTCGVLSGYSDRGRLESAGPDLLCDSVGDLQRKIGKRAQP